MGERLSKKNAMHILGIEGGGKYVKGEHNTAYAFTHTYVYTWYMCTIRSSSVHAAYIYSISPRGV